MTRTMTRLPVLGQRLPDLVNSSYHHLGVDNTNWLLKKTVAPLYCCGPEVDQLASVVKALRGNRITTILHLASESPELLSPQDHLANLKVRLDLLTQGDVVAIKLTSFYFKTELLTTVFETDDFKILPELEELIKECLQRDLFVTIDAEESELNPTINLVVRHFMAKYNRACVRILGTYQCYLRNTLETLTGEVAYAKENGYRFGAKLVRGAYLETERLKGLGNLGACPCWETIEETSQCYLDAVDLLVSHGCPMIVASHNDEAVRQIRLKYPGELIRYATLLGMNDTLTQECLQADLLTAKFVPYGPSEVVIPYLIRRLQENRDMLVHAGK